MNFLGKPFGLGRVWGLGICLVFSFSVLAEPVALECRYKNPDQRPDWIAIIGFDSDEGEAEMTVYGANYSNQPRFHRLIDRLPIDRNSREVVIRRADLEKTYRIDRRTLESRTERQRITEVGTLETLVQLGSCNLRDRNLGDRMF
mgnify:FL=1|jgi:hypothetical protein